MQVSDSSMFAPAPLLRKSNTLAIVAACCSIAGLLSLCVPQFMILCGVGFVLGLIALFKSPRGFAVLALLLGFLGVGLGLTHLAARALARLTSNVVQSGAQTVQNTVEATQISTAIEAYRYEKKGELPGSLSLLLLPMATTLDAWGEPYLYTPDAATNSYRLASKGPDRTINTDDDIDLTNISSIEPYVRDAIPFPPRPPVMPGSGQFDRPLNQSNPGKASPDQPEQRRMPNDRRSPTPGPA